MSFPLSSTTTDIGFFLQDIAGFTTLAGAGSAAGSAGPTFSSVQSADGEESMVAEFSHMSFDWTPSENLPPCFSRVTDISLIHEKLSNIGAFTFTRSGSSVDSSVDGVRFKFSNSFQRKDCIEKLKKEFEKLKIAITLNEPEESKGVRFNFKHSILQLKKREFSQLLGFNPSDRNEAHHFDSLCESLTRFLRNQSIIFAQLFVNCSQSEFNRVIKSRNSSQVIAKPTLPTQMESKREFKEPGYTPSESPPLSAVDLFHLLEEQSKRNATNFSVYATPFLDGTYRNNYIRQFYVDSAIQWFGQGRDLDHLSKLTLADAKKLFRVQINKTNPIFADSLEKLWEMTNMRYLNYGRFLGLSIAQGDIARPPELMFNDVVAYIHNYIHNSETIRSSALRQQLQLTAFTPKKLLSHRLSNYMLQNPQDTHPFFIWMGDPGRGQVIDGSIKIFTLNLNLFVRIDTGDGGHQDVTFELITLNKDQPLVLDMYGRKQESFDFLFDDISEVVRLMQTPQGLSLLKKPIRHLPYAETFKKLGAKPRTAEAQVEHKGDVKSEGASGSYGTVGGFRSPDPRKRSSLLSSAAPFVPEMSLGSSAAGSAAGAASASKPQQREDNEVLERRGVKRLRSEINPRPSKVLCTNPKKFDISKLIPHEMQDEEMKVEKKS